MQEFISGSHKVTQLLKCFYKLLESFEIKHLTGDFVRIGSWCFLLFIEAENPQNKLFFLLNVKTCSFSPMVLSGTMK